MFEIILADLQRTVRECGAGRKVEPDLVILDCNAFFIIAKPLTLILNFLV